MTPDFSDEVFLNFFYSKLLVPAAEVTAEVVIVEGTNFIVLVIAKICEFCIEELCFSMPVVVLF